MIHDLDIEINALELKCDNVIEKIKEINKEKVKDYFQIINLNFTERENALKSNMAKINNKLQNISKSIKDLESNKDKMENYKELVVDSYVEISKEINEIGLYKDELSKTLKDRGEKIRKIEEAINIKYEELVTIFSTPDKNFYKDTIEHLSKCKLIPEECINIIESHLDIFNKERDRIESNLKNLRETKLVIKEKILNYLEEIYNNLDLIDKNSSIKINNENKKLFQIIQDEWKDEYSIKIDNYVDEIIEDCLALISDNKNISEKIEQELKAAQLYKNIIGIKNVSIKVYKIEKSKTVLLNWDEAAKNSGGEGFVSAFIVLQSLMDYTKRSSGDFSKDKSEGKILIMDNPFGKATSEHLLIPVFDMANKYNTQLICLSDVGGDSVYNRFDNIYVLTTEELKLSPGVEIVKSEYSKCSEINSTRFLTELKEVQVSLF